MKLWQVMLIIGSLGLALAFYTPYVLDKKCVRLETGTTGELKNGLFCDKQACRPVTVKYEVVECQ